MTQEERKTRDLLLLSQLSRKRAIEGRRRNLTHTSGERAKRHALNSTGRGGKEMEVVNMRQQRNKTVPASSKGLTVSQNITQRKKRGN